VDYVHLGKWCMERTGQLIVCDNTGADWLPFRPLTDERAAGFRVNADAAKMGEVIYTRHSDENVGVFA
jgi:hypothetical protein